MYATNMRKSLKTYIDSVDATLTELVELESLAEVHSQVVETNRQINLEIEDDVRTIGNLQAQRVELFDDFHNATFEGESERIEEIQHEKDDIDNRIAALEESITVAKGKLVEVDGNAIAEMLQRVDAAEVPGFFGPRIKGASFRLPNGAYRSTPPSGLLVELQEGNDALMAEINAAKARIRGMQQWAKYVPSEPETEAHKRLVEALTSA